MLNVLMTTLWSDKVLKTHCTHAVQYLPQRVEERVALGIGWDEGPRGN